MSNASLVTVLMPVHNAATHFPDALKSIINQSYKTLEIIIVNDGCSDESIDLVYSFADPRIVIVHNARNLGLAASLNKSICLAQGSLMARMDADDIAHPDRIQREVDFLQQYPNVDVVGSALQYFGKSRYRNSFPDSHEDCRARLLFNVCFGHPSVMFRKDLFARTRIQYDGALRQYSEEYDLWCRLADVATFANIPDVLVQYRTYDLNQKRDAVGQRLANSEAIRKRYLVSHLGDVSSGEWATHQMAAFVTSATNLDDLKRVDDWFNEILGRNEVHGAFDQAALERQLADQFFELCYHLAGIGWGSYSFFHRTRWAQWRSWTGLQRIKYLAKSFSSVQP